MKLLYDYSTLACSYIPTRTHVRIEEGIIIIIDPVVVPFVLFHVNLPYNNNIIQYGYYAHNIIIT